MRRTACAPASTRARNHLPDFPSENKDANHTARRPLIQTARAARVCKLCTGSERNHASGGLRVLGCLNPFN
eukprot:6853225-Alexandrium_andersonii.AAC.1